MSIQLVFTGPESTGKTTLVHTVVKHFNQEMVAEYARVYIDALDRTYQQKDLLAIAEGQIELEERAFEKEKYFVICDTDLLTIKIWSEYKYGNCDPWILEQLQLRKPAHYFLCGTDVPWTFDPQREHPNQRAELFDIYEKEIQELDVPYTILVGSFEERMEVVKAWISARC